MKKPSPSFLFPVFLSTACSATNLEPRDCTDREANEITATQDVIELLDHEGRLPQFEGVRTLIEGLLNGKVNEEIFCADTIDDTYSGAAAYTDGKIVAIEDLSSKSSLHAQGDFDCSFGGEFTVDKYLALKDFHSFLSRYYPDHHLDFSDYMRCNRFYDSTAEHLFHEYYHKELDERHSSKSRRLERKIKRAEKRDKDQKVKELEREQITEHECDPIYVQDEKIGKRTKKFFKDLDERPSEFSFVDEVETCVVGFDFTPYDEAKDALWSWVGGKYDECSGDVDCLEEALARYDLWSEQLKDEQEHAYHKNKQNCIEDMGRWMFEPVQELYMPEDYEGLPFL